MRLTCGIVLWLGGKGDRARESKCAGSVKLCMLEMKVERADGPVLGA